jgi:hypothetical protein
VALRAAWIAGKALARRVGWDEDDEEVVHVAEGVMAKVGSRC